MGLSVKINFRGTESDCGVSSDLDSDLGNETPKTCCMWQTVVQ